MSAQSPSDLISSGEQQRALVGHCFFDESFFLICKRSIKPEWLTGNLLNSQVYQQLIKFYENYSLTPKSLMEFMAEPFFVTQNENDRSNYEQTILKAVEVAQQFSRDVLLARIETFRKQMSIRENAVALIKAITKNDYETATHCAKAIVAVAEQGRDQRDETITRLIDEALHGL